MKAIVSAASGRSVSSSTTSASGVSRGGGSRRGRSGSGSAGLAEGDDAPARPRSPLAACARGPGAGVSAPASLEDVGRAEHVAGAAPIRRPLHFHSEEKGTSPRPAPASPGKRAAIASRVRLRSPALAAKRPERRVRRRPGRRPRRPRPRAAAARRRSASRSCRRRSCRPRRGSRSRSSAGPACRVARQAHGGDGEGDAHQQHQALGDQRHQAGGRRLRRLVEVGAAQLQGEDQQRPPAAPSRRCRRRSPG